METEYKYLLHLLGAYLRGDVPEKCEDADWQKLMQLARIHNVLGILGYMGKKYPICPDPRHQAEMRALCLNTVQIFARRNALAESMAAELEKAGIDHILMKGYVLRDFYPDPDLRTFNDIDIVIRPEDRQRCDDLMLAQGFVRHADWEPVFSYVRGNELYEIHTDIMEIDVAETGDQQAYFRRCWDYARPIREHSCRFTPEFHFLYLLTHTAKHVHGSGAGIRMYLDVAAFVRHYGETLDWPWIREQLKVLQLKRFADVVFAAVESWFGVEIPMDCAGVSQEILDRFLEFTMEAGTFGHYQRDAALASLKNGDGDDGASRIRRVLHRTFPKAETIQNRYEYLQDKPWLLPVAWIHRLVKNREKLGEHSREMKQIISMDDREVRRMKKLMRDIGL